MRVSDRGVLGEFLEVEEGAVTVDGLASEQPSHKVERHVGSTAAGPWVTARSVRRPQRADPTSPLAQLELLNSDVLTNFLRIRSQTLHEYREMVDEQFELLVTWLAHQRPGELNDYWMNEYPAISTASENLAALEVAGYSPVGYFNLPESCWLDHYYRPMQGRFAEFVERQDHSRAARQVVEAEQREIDLYERFSEFFGYGFYIATPTKRS